ncbi:MAG: hypothetical protein GWP08_05045 [Nitrospiraceae bacterium]|nr:hypothetical protein [Nitrospiraceae bacterium]
MAGTASVGGVGAGLSQAQFRVGNQARVLKEQQPAPQSVGNAALELLRSVMTLQEGHDLDVQA